MKTLFELSVKTFAIWFGVALLFFLFDRPISLVNEMFLMVGAGLLGVFFLIHILPNIVSFLLRCVGIGTNTEDVK